MQQISKDFINGTKSHFTLSVLCLTALFLSTLLLQSYFPAFVIRLILVLCQFIICIFLNATLGKSGYMLSCSYSFIQWIIAMYEYWLFDNHDSLYIGLVAATALCCNIIFYAIVKYNSKKLYDLKDLYNTTCEQISRLDTRNRELDLALNRTALIVKNQAAKANNNNSNKQLGNNSIDSGLSQFTTNNFIDSVTTLPNRDKILDQIELFIDDSISFSQSSTGFSADAFSPITVIYLKLDNLHLFVGNSSHQVVDLFIQGVAHRLRESANEEDIVGRIVNGEFAVISKRILHQDECLKYADTLRQSITSFFANNNHPSNVTASAGIAVYPKNARFSGQLLKAAERAAKTATDNGGNQNVVCDTELRDTFFSSKTNEEINKLFENALSDGEIYIVYQPQMSASGKLLGFEAFTRWNSKELGNVPPSLFLDVATKSNFIYKLSHFIFENVAKALVEVNSLNPELKMVMNVSASQMKSGIVDTELRKLSLNLDFNNLEFDIPEEMLTTSFNDVKGCIERIYNMGISLSLDNFGRGFSSLNNIPLLPINAVKLDSDFTNNDSEANQILSSSIISLLNEIEISVVATGIDNESHYELLKGFGCNAFQGKYICSPLKQNELHEYILRNMI